MSAAQLARETGITQQNLSRWLSEARNLPFTGSDNGVASAWTVEQKARVIAQAAGLAGDELTRYLERESPAFEVSEPDTLALEEAAEESVGMTKRIRKLERELTRKEKALAEAAALLVLREPVESLFQPEEELIDERIGDEELNFSS